MRRLLALAPLAIVGTLVACGGGGDSSPIVTPPPPPPASSNVAQITVDAGPSGNSVNTPFVSVTICAPGSTTNCQTIDHIEVDTASSGLRLISSVVDPTLALPQEVDASGTAIVECAAFADGFSWGPVKTADVRVSDEAAPGVPVQIIGDPAFTAVPAACSAVGKPEDTVAAFGANGILGVGPFIEDAQAYYTCAAGSCAADTTIAVGLEVSNPVAFFTNDNNGVVVQLPAVGSTGAPPLTGSLIFGIGTESNNGLGTATVYTLDPNFGSFTITYNSHAYTNSYLDTGSNANYFNDSTIPTCSSGFFCPPSTLTLSATITGLNNVSVAVPFYVANADALFNTNLTAVAFNDLAAPNPDSTSFDFGLPFFFNNTVFTAIAGADTPGGLGPYVAF